jgi:hypothetical protein
MPIAANDKQSCARLTALCRQRASLGRMLRLSVNLEPKGAVGPLLDSGECHDPEISCQA